MYVIVTSAARFLISSKMASLFKPTLVGPVDGAEDEGDANLYNATIPAPPIP